MCPLPVNRVIDLVGISGNSSIGSNTATVGTALFQGTCGQPDPTNDYYYTNIGSGRFLVFKLNLGETVPLGGLLQVGSVGVSNGDTVAFVGTGCPSSQQSFGCFIGNDDAMLDWDFQISVTQSRVEFNATQRLYYVIIGGYGSADVTSGVAWQYFPPSPSPTPSVTSTGSVTLGASASQTASASLTASASPTASASATMSESSAPTPTQTPFCGGLITSFKGMLQQNLSITDRATGSTGLVTMLSSDPTAPSAATKTCTSVNGGAQASIVFNRNKHMYLLDLAALGLRTGGTLVLDTCSGGTMNTVLAVGGRGASCPTTNALWICTHANDNVTLAVPSLVGAGNVCPNGNGFGASGITISSAQSFYYVVVTLPNPTTFRVGTYNLRWSYMEPSPSATSPSTASSSITSSPTASLTPSLSPSASITPSGSATLSVGATRSVTQTGSNLPTPTPSEGFTLTPTATPVCNPAIPVAARITGYNTSTLVLMPATGPSLVSVTTPCSGGGYGFRATPHQALIVDLGQSFSPGGRLFVTTLEGGTQLDTTLYLGTGCPYSVAQFGCVYGESPLGLSPALITKFLLPP